VLTTGLVLLDTDTDASWCCRHRVMMSQMHQ